MPSEAQRLRQGFAAIAGATLAYSMAPSLFKLVESSAWSVAAQRLCAGVPAAWLVALLFRERPSLRGLRESWPGGVAFGMHITVFIWATQRTTVANVQFIGALFPILVVMVAPAMFGERRQWRAIVGLFGAALGLSLMLFGGQTPAARSAFGDVLAVGNLLAWTAFFLFSKRARQRGVSAIEYQVWSMTVAAVLALPIALSQVDDVWPIAPRNLTWILLLAWGPGTFGHLLANWAHRYVPAQTQSLASLAVPVLASLIAWPIHDEPISAIAGLGGAIVMGSVGAAALRPS